MDMQMLSLTEEQRAIRQMVRDFVDKELRPFVRDFFMRSGPPGQHDTPPEELVRKIDSVGLRTLMVPERYGGIRYDMQTLAIIEEELSRGGWRLGMENCWKTWDRFTRILPQHLQDYWFPRIMDDPTFTVCNAATEPRGACDRWLPYKHPEANMHTRAVLQDGHWVINGQKQFSTNAAAAKLISVAANTQPDVGGEFATFLVPRDTPGLTVGPQPGDLFFKDCRVPEDHRLPPDPTPFNSKVLTSSTLLGLGVAAYDETVDFCRTRFQGGRYIIQHQLVGAALAEMYVRLESTRAMVNWTARATDLGASDAYLKGMLCLVHVAQTVVEVCRKAVELWGGMGTTPESTIQTYLQMAIVGLHLDGTMDIQKLRIAQDLFPETVGAYAGPILEP